MYKFLTLLILISLSHCTLADSSEIWVFPISASGELVPYSSNSGHPNDKVDLEWNNKRTLLNLKGTFGSCKFEEDGSIDFFNLDGELLFYHPSDAHFWSIFQKNGPHAGFLYYSNNQLCLGLTEESYAILVDGKERNASPGPHLGP